MYSVGCVSSTTAKGSPYGGAPKSGWRLVVEASIEASHASLFAFTGSFVISMFHMLSAGKTVQLVPGMGARETWVRRRDGMLEAGVASAPEARQTIRTSTVRPLRMEATVPHTSAEVNRTSDPSPPQDGGCLAP